MFVTAAMYNISPHLTGRSIRRFLTFVIIRGSIVTCSTQVITFNSNIRWDGLLVCFWLGAFDGACFAVEFVGPTKQGYMVNDFTK